MCMDYPSPQRRISHFPRTSLRQNHRLRCGSLGLAMALPHATSPECDHIILYADNGSAFRTVLDTSIHPSQMCAILSNQLVYGSLPCYYARLMVARCPGHVGIPR